MNMDKSIQVLMLISTILSLIDPSESTRKTNKLRKHIRIKLKEFYTHNNEDYRRCSHEASNAWEYAKKELNDENYTINLDVSCRALYALLNGSPAQNIWFSEKTFEDAMQSIYANGTRLKDEAETERDSNRLVDIFADALDIKRDNRLRVLKQTISMNQILEGK